ncbi:MAG: Gfo/Idh/MocA family oxidoreductase [Cyclobacteriaceae bacterium]|nr:Gfo/Idh/MocA family oxidoreductase [Cyclobacteriaceae bacterium]
MNTTGIGFIGAGGIARAHAYALQAIKYYYNDAMPIRWVSVNAARAESRTSFASAYGFERAETLDEFVQNPDIEAVFILGPNSVHYEHLMKALSMPKVKAIYLEKPVCASKNEEEALRKVLSSLDPSINIQVGFQYLQTASVRKALEFWKSGVLGKALHFDLKYYHGDYLQSSYRSKRGNRLTPAPDGGAMADLGSHGISLLMAFFNESLQITGALQSGSFEDVPKGSDLFSSISLLDPYSEAVGTLSASRISAGTGDLIALEIFAEKGCLKYNSHNADYFEYFLEESGQWTRVPVGSNYAPFTSFPSGHVPPGWLRSMVHAHYIFLTGQSGGSFVPDLAHGLAVQRIVRETAEHLNVFRHLKDKYKN